MISSAILGLVMLAGVQQPAADARLASRAYSANEVVRVDGRAGVQATIAFGEDEHIENVAIGDSNSWQVTPNKRANLLFVKPLAARARTNLTVVTNRRSYFFDLVASPTAKPLYLLRFQYPTEKARANGATSLAATAANLLQQGSAASPLAINRAWTTKGKSRLLPSQIYDDGSTTYLRWPVGTPIPAILIRNDKGEEGPVNFSVSDDVIAIDGVPALIVLRAGKDSATLTNRSAPRPRSTTPSQIASAAPARAQGN